MAKAEAKKKSQKIRENLGLVQIFARTGRLPIISDSEEFLAPGVPTRQNPGVVLDFGNEGVCKLDPRDNADTIKVFREWMEDGSDPRIVQLGVIEVAPDALTPPFPKWDATKPESCVEMVSALGLDPERCLRYELQKDEPRDKLVKALEKQVDDPATEDPLSEPEL